MVGTNNGGRSICDYGKRPQPGDIALLPFDKKAERLFLCNIYSLTHDNDLLSLEASNPYPIPEDLIDKDLGQKLNWTPIAYEDETTKDYYLNLAEKLGTPQVAIPPEFVVATVLRLSRNFAF